MMMENTFDFEKARAMAVRVMICELISGGLYRKLTVNPAWANLKRFHFSALPEDDLLACFNEIKNEHATKLAEDHLFDQAYDSLEESEQIEISELLLELVNHEYRWDISEKIGSERALEEIISFRALFRKHEEELRKQISEMIGERSFEVSLPESEEEIESLLQELCDEIGPVPYLITLNDLSEASWAARAFEQMIEEEKKSA